MLYALCFLAGIVVGVLWLLLGIITRLFRG